jgi:hypothetical protein
MKAIIDQDVSPFISQLNFYYPNRKFQLGFDRGLAFLFLQNFH